MAKSEQIPDEEVKLGKISLVNHDSRVDSQTSTIVMPFEEKKIYVNESVGQKLAMDCAICLNFMIEPVKLKCGHRFCAYCITAAAKHNRLMKCPLCRDSCKKRFLQKDVDVGF